MLPIAARSDTCTASLPHLLPTGAEATKPDDWDDEEDGEWEPPKVSNPRCTEGPGCGEWKRPKISNPAYKGKWSAPLIDNPLYKASFRSYDTDISAADTSQDIKGSKLNSHDVAFRRIRLHLQLCSDALAPLPQSCGVYQGPWSPKKIANPDYYLDEEPLKNVGKIGGVALEIWTMDDNYFFDNILIAADPSAAEEARETYWQPKKELEASNSPSSLARSPRQAYQH